MNQNKPP